MIATSRVSNVRSEVASIAFVLGTCVVVTQRLSVPVGPSDVPLFNVVLVVVLTWLAVTGALTLPPWRVVSFLLLCSGGGLVLVAAGGAASSLGLAILLWLPAVVGYSDSNMRQSEFANGVAMATILAAVLAIVQSATSAVTGWFPDPLAELPRSMRVGGYNTTDPVVSGSSWMKANGMVFLEPSFLSLMTAFAIVLILSGAAGAHWSPAQRRVGIALLVAGFCSSVAASGLVLIPAIVLALARSGARRFIQGSLWAIVAFALLLASPLWEPLRGRVFTADLDAGSNSARLVRPYELILAPWFSSGPWYGNGPGSARATAQSMYTSWQDEVTTPTMVKLLYEYGILGGLIALALVGLVVAGSRVDAAARLAALLILFVPTDGLMNGMLAAIVALMSVGSSAAPSGCDQSPKIATANCDRGDMSTARIYSVVANRKGALA